MNQAEQRKLNQVIMRLLKDEQPRTLEAMAQQVEVNVSLVRKSLNLLVRTGFIHHNLDTNEYSKKTK